MICMNGKGLTIGGCLKSSRGPAGLYNAGCLKGSTGGGGRLAKAALCSLLLAAVALLPMAPGAEAQQKQVILDEPKLWGYAESLFNQGEYYRAVSEYWRLLQFFPQGEHGPAARLRIGQALLWGGEPAQAIAHLNAVGGHAALAAQQDDVLYLKGLSRLELDRGRPYPLRQQSIEYALKDLRAISPGWRGAGQVRGFLQAMGDPPQLPVKSPALAGALSAVLPGSGSFYVGRYAEGSLAFFVTALFVAASVEAFEDDREGAGLVLGSLGLAFYGGSILAAVNGAHKFNDGASSLYLSRQQQKFGIVVDRGGLAAAFKTTY